MFRVFAGGMVSVAGIVLALIISPSVFARPLNPSPSPNTSETSLDRYFRIAFVAATAGDFDTAIINYGRAAIVTNSECDRQHAKAGIQAAKGAKEVLKKYGLRSRPTQGFTNQLRKLTTSLPCVSVR